MILCSITVVVGLTLVILSLIMYRETKNEMQVGLGGVEKMVPTTYYIMDYKSVVEITKWKCLKISEMLGSELKNANLKLIFRKLKVKDIIAQIVKEFTIC